MPTSDPILSPIDEILLHPLFWHRKKSKEFLGNLSDILISNTGVRKEFQKLFDKVVPGTSWLDELDQDPKTYFEKKQKIGKKPLYNGGSLHSLLRAIRNLTQHFDQEYVIDAKKYFDVDPQLGNGQDPQDISDSAENGNDKSDDENCGNNTSNGNGESTQPDVNQNNQHSEENSENGDEGTQGTGHTDAKKKIKKRLEKKTLKDMLSPYFGESVDDSLAYWLHKFPNLLPVCYAFAQTNKEMRSKNYYYLEGETNGTLSTDSNVDGIFNELYVCMRSVNHEKLLRQYEVVGTTGKLTFLKLHPWVLGEHSLIEINYLQQENVVLRKQAQFAKLEDRQTRNKMVDISCGKNSKNGHLVTGLWKINNFKFHSPTFTQAGFVILLCGKAETGLKHAYWTNCYITKSVVIMTEDSYLDVAQSVEKFQNLKGFANGIKREQPKFHEKHLAWDELMEPHQQLLLTRKVCLQKNVETFRNLVGLAKQNFGQKTNSNIMGNIENEFILQLIHSTEMIVPQIIKTFESLPDKTVEMRRKLRCEKNFDLKQLDGGRMFTQEPLHEKANCLKVLQTTTTIKQPRILAENELLHPSNGVYFLKHLKRHYLISGCSGVGKSTMLNRLANKLANQTGYRTQRTITAFLRFPDIIKNFSSKEGTQGTFLLEEGLSKEVLSKIIASEMTSSKFCSTLVTPIVFGEMNYIIFLLLDAFDEVRDGDRDKCARVLKLLNDEFPHVRMYVTTRKENAQTVENILKAMTIYLLPLNYEEKKIFLTNYWLKQIYTNVSTVGGGLQEQERFLHGLATKCIDVGEPDLLGTPFCLMLIAELCLESILAGNKDVESLTEGKFGNLKALISKFIAHNMTTLSSKQYQPGLDRDVLSKTISIWFKKERKEMLLVQGHNENEMPVVYQFTTG